jgi:hypothetical protein
MSRKIHGQVEGRRVIKKDDRSVRDVGVNDDERSTNQRSKHAATQS